MIAGIHQPAYLPWLGYFDRIRSVDTFIFLDTVQFQKGSFQNRNKILTASGPIWLTVPVVTSGKLFDTTLKDVEIDATQNWQSKHWSTLKMNYGATSEYANLAPQLERFYNTEWSSLADLCWEMLLEFNRIFNIKTKVIRASELGPIQGKKSDLVLNLCRSMNASRYLSGSQGRDYLDVTSFLDAGIDVEYQNYMPVAYKQRSKEFVPAMAVVDLLFNEQKPLDYL
jgi:hypothetical protein